MIARHWHCVVNASDEDAFEQFLHKTAIPKYVNNPGFMDYNIIKKYDVDVVHFNIISYWQNFDYIKQFAGTQIEKAKQFEEYDQFVIDYAKKVKHYEVVDHVLVTS
jgi:heme-degrading monooxygenase HmoA